MNEIIHNLFLGDEWHAKQAANAFMIVICVLEERPEDEPANAIHIPIMAFDPTLYDDPNRPLPTYDWRVNMINLSIVCDAIDAAREMGRAVYVHCAAGIERSPLTVAWYLHTRYNLSLDDAYETIRKVRPIVMDRRSFLPHPYNQE